MSNYESYVWPEHVAPPELIDCQKCELSQQRSRVIWGEGNPLASIMVILDNPGARENTLGEPFVCGTRETLQETAAQVGLGADDLYVTYLLKCRPIRAYDKPQSRSICFSHLRLQLEEVKREIAMCLGNVAVSSFFGDPEAEVKKLRGQIHDINGVRTVVSYHPLAVRRRPVLARLFLEDWKRLADAWTELKG